MFGDFILVIGFVKIQVMIGYAASGQDRVCLPGDWRTWIYLNYIFLQSNNIWKLLGLSSGHRIPGWSDAIAIGSPSACLEAPRSASECRQNSEFRSDSFWIFCIFVIGFIYEFDKRLALIRFYWFFNDFFHKFNIINYEFRSDSLWGFYVFFIGFIYEFDKRFALICFHWFAYDFFSFV